MSFGDPSDHPTISVTVGGLGETVQECDSGDVNLAAARRGVFTGGWCTVGSPLIY